MCGRFALATPGIDVLAHELGATVSREPALAYRPRWNIAPTQDHWIVRLVHGRRTLVSARFGIEGHSGRLVFNARSETAAELRTFRDAFRGGRCVVPADGFFEWQGGRGARRPLWFHAPDGGLLLFAALALEQRGAPAFVILTTAANDLVRPVHDRMPALLSRDAAEEWLSRPDAALLRPAPERCLVSREVSEAVNDVANDGPELLEPPAPRAQLRLL
ncbi:SOS response-associated peptidase [Anaeromyxobacter terrae]|uniref:SOS response-associated peptidase n=1 Tax=Anaeromyxobacter terrae TaxID=2925406 RepID=UPI001F5ABF5A|nr:SOS response-associated peptidase [Anaeromyxobacter sp. SG22]